MVGSDVLGIRHANRGNPEDLTRPTGCDLSEPTAQLSPMPHNPIPLIPNLQSGTGEAKGGKDLDVDRLRNDAQHQIRKIA